MPQRGEFGFLSVALFDWFVEDYLIVEHLWVLHILHREAPEHSKFLPQYACIKDLHILFISCISLAIETNNVVVTHDKNGNTVTYYRAEYDNAIGSFEHPTEGTLYQYQLVIMFQNGSLCNGFTFGNGYKVKVKPKKVESGASAGGKGGSGDPTHAQHLQSWKYPSGEKYRGQPGQPKPPRKRPSRKKQTKIQETSFMKK